VSFQDFNSYESPYRFERECLETHLKSELVQTNSLFRWVSRLRTGSDTRCCGPRGGTAVQMEQKTPSKFLPWPG